MLALAPLAFAGRPDHALADDGPMLYDYFMGALGAADERRRMELASLRDKTQLSALQDKVRRVMHAGIGVFPDRTPLNARQVGEIRKSDYTIEKIVFESRPEYYVTANVYRPNSTATRRAAVVESCGHYESGKAAPDYQRACIGLAKKGFVVLIFDPMGQGERVMFSERGAKRPGATTEHSLAGAPAILLGRTLANYRMWDAMRAYDYLETRSDVEPTRMGMLGHSGGGMMTILTTPLEPRIRAAMSCCAVTSFYHKTKAMLMADPEQIVPAIYPNGVDHPEMIATVAPRAFLIGAVLRDFVPLDGTRRTYDETKHIYEMLGKPENFAKVESDNTHKLDKNLREACYGWMLQHLTGESGDAREPAMEVETEENLWCTKAGSILDLPNSRTVFDLGQSYSHELAARRASAGGPSRARVKELLGLPPAAAAPEPGINLPVTLLDSGKNRDTLLMVISPAGRSSAAALQLSRAFVDAGYSVLGADLRGWGETTCTRPKKEKFTWDEFFAWRAMEMGRPLLGMRAQDLLTAARQNAGERKKVYVVGLEAGGLVALHAAAVNDSIAGVATYRTLTSYQDVIENLHYGQPASSLVWGALTAYDLPELAKAIQPRPYVAGQTPQEILNGLRLL